jgi:hypothetical protein
LEVSFFVATHWFPTRFTLHAIVHERKGPTSCFDFFLIATGEQLIEELRRGHHLNL